MGWFITRVFVNFDDNFKREYIGDLTF